MSTLKVQSLYAFSLIHGTFEELRPKQGNLPGYEEIHHSVVAKTSLEDMIKNSKIEARSSFGYFKLKINMFRPRFDRIFRNEDANPEWMKAVCFSETPLCELKNFYQAVLAKRNKYQKYGLAFWQENVRQAGGNPIFYIDSRRKDYQNLLDETYRTNQVNLIPMMHLLEGFGPLFIPKAIGYSDFRWEREWRKKDDFFFKSTDVAFGICPETEISHFTQLANKKIIFIDPDWDRPTVTDYLQVNSSCLLTHL